MEYIEKYYIAAKPIGDSLIQWARPEGWIVGPTSTWPLTDFGTASLIALSYLTFVFLGMVCNYS